MRAPAMPADINRKIIITLITAVLLAGASAAASAAAPPAMSIGRLGRMMPWGSSAEGLTSSILAADPANGPPPRR
jgi:ABC-type transport system substrate-binding protein